MKLILAATAALLLSSAVASATCGDQGGPGYRDDNGDCTYWHTLRNVCGADLSRCTPENVHPDAAEAARSTNWNRIEELKIRAHEQAKEEQDDNVDDDNAPDAANH
jgi:hypothetical protein